MREDNLKNIIYVMLVYVLLGCSQTDSTSNQNIDFAANAEKLVLNEFQPSTLSKEEQTKELAWFTRAAEPFRGMTINVVSETLTTHEYESEVLTEAFFEITGIKVNHDLIQEGDVIEKLQTQMQTGQNVYDAYVNDSDLIGTHSRYGYVIALSDFMENEGSAFTLPTLDLEDFIGISFTFLFWFCGFFLGFLFGTSLGPQDRAGFFFFRFRARGGQFSSGKVEVTVGVVGCGSGVRIRG